jgi:hypothetical protein
VEATPEGAVTTPNAALGAPDATGAELGPGSSLRLMVGSEIYDELGIDLILNGQVTSPSSVQVNEVNCPVSPLEGQGLRVEASQNGSTWAPLGYWTQSKEGGTGTGQDFHFNLICAKINAVRYIRITSLGQATATLDALTAEHCDSSPHQGVQ